MKAKTQLAVLAAAMLLIGSIDFLQRIHVGRDASLRAFEPTKVLSLPPLDTEEAVLQRLAGWLPGFAPAPGAATPGPAAASFALRGVFVARAQPAAVLAVTEAPGLPARNVRVVVGDVVSGWTVSAIDRRAVTLQRDAGTRQLVMFARKGEGAAPSGADVE